MAEKVLRDLKMPPSSFTPKPDHTLWLRRSNDRPNLHYVVRKMLHPKSLFLDLAFLVPDGTTPLNQVQLPRFLVYFNSRQEAQGGGKYLRSRLPLAIRHLIVWVHAGMSDEHRKESLERFEAGLLIGIVCTDALGMVRNLSDFCYVPATDGFSPGHGS